MTERSFDDVLLTQVFVDGFRLGRRFHDYQSFCHRRLSKRGALRRMLGETRITQMTLPHFNKVLARKLFHQTQHFQFEKCGDQLGRRRIFHFFKQIVQMYGSVHLQTSERPAGDVAQLRRLIT